MKPKQTWAQKPFSITSDTKTVWAGPVLGIPPIDGHKEHVLIGTVHMKDHRMHNEGT